MKPFGMFALVARHCLPVWHKIITPDKASSSGKKRQIIFKNFDYLAISSSCLKRLGISGLPKSAFQM